MYLLIFFLLLRPPLRSTLFPYTTLFRSAFLAAIEEAVRLQVVNASILPDTLEDVINGNPEYDTPEALANKLEDLADRKSTRLNSSHSQISYAVFCLKKKKNAT